MSNPTTNGNLDVRYDPQLRVGRVVQYKDKDGLFVTGTIRRIEVNSEGETQLQTLKIKRLP